MEQNQIPKYNRLRGGLNATYARPTTFKVVEGLTGIAETYTVETGRAEDGDYCFVERVDETGVIRICLPPKVINAIARQRDALSLAIRRRIGREKARERKERGELPFVKKEKAS